MTDHIHLYSREGIDFAITKLEEAILDLWNEMPAEQVKILTEEKPELVRYCQELHEEYEHTQRGQ